MAHREEILNQSLETVKSIRLNASFGFINSLKKDTKGDVIFASVQSLGKEEYLN